MPATTFARPSQLHLYPTTRAAAPARWSPSSDSDEDETTSADSNDSNEDSRDDEHSFDGPTDLSTARVSRAPALPAIQVRPSRPVSPPRSSPLSPLAAGSASTASPTAGAFPHRPHHRGLGMSPLSPGGTAATRPAGLPKATPLARMLLDRSIAAPAAKPKKTTKLIVPSKPFRSTFELSLSSTELARK